MLDALRHFFRCRRPQSPSTTPANKEQFAYLREGEFDPQLNKWVKKLIVVENDSFAVYLDNNCDVQFIAYPSNVKEFAKVQTQVIYLEQASSFLKHNQEALLHVRCLLGDAYAQVLSSGDSKDAAEPLALARTILAETNPDVSFGWYFSSASKTCLALATIGLALWVLRTTPLVTSYLGRTAFELVLCAIAGAIGAFFSISTRATHLTLNALAGKQSHRLETRARLFAGMLSASLLVMALKSKLILAPLADGNGHLTTLLLLSALAGISERVVPSLVSSFEQSVKKSEKELEKRGNALETSVDPQSVPMDKNQVAAAATSSPLGSVASESGSETIPAATPVDVGSEETNESEPAVASAPKQTKPDAQVES